MPTQTSHDRVAVTLSGALQYRVTAGVIDAGDLPDTALFVFTIVDDTDPKEDTFTRVATIADFDEILVDRATAVANNATAYRRSEVTLYYSNLETADNAQTLLKEKIDELVTDYELYLTSFYTTTETIVHPQLSAATYDAAVTAYQDALRDTLDAEEARDTAETAYTAAQTAADDTTAAAALAATVSSDCSTTKGYFDNVVTGFTALDQAGDTFLAAAQTYYAAKKATTPDSADMLFDAAVTAFIAALQTATGALTTAGTNQTAFSTVCGNRSSESTTAQSTQATALTAVATARRTFEEAQAAVEVAQAAEDTALAAVQTLKPSFDPTSVDPSS